MATGNGAAGSTGTITTNGSGPSASAPRSEDEQKALAARLIARARELAPLVRADEPEATVRTTYSPELHEAFLDAGFYHMYVPRRYGGLEVDVPTFVRVIAEIGRGSLGIAWGLCLTANHALQVASYFGEQAQDELFGPGTFRAASVAAPTVVATPIEGGYRLDGEVAYCSGIPYSTHFLGQALLADDGAGMPRVVLYVAPESEFRRLGVWGGLTGLKATGSDTIRFDGGVVPSHMVIEDADMVDFPADHGTAGLALHGNPMYGGRGLAIFTLSLAAPVIGGAFGVLDEYAEAMRTRKTPLPPFVDRVADPDFQRHYGSARTRIDFARAAMLQAAEQHMELCRDSAAGIRPASRFEDWRIAAIAREACLHAWEAVEQDLLRTIGSSALTEGQRFERAFRDFGQVAGHRNFALREMMFRELAKLDLGVEVPA